MTSFIAVIALAHLSVWAACAESQGDSRLPPHSAPSLVEPLDGATTWQSIPHFQWKPLFDAKPEAMPSYVIQIATDKDFKTVADQDALAAVVLWYVPDKELPAGTYWWRVAGVDAEGTQGPWSEPRRFTVQAAPVFRVQAGASFEEIRKVVREAAAHTPARVVFDKGEYRLDPGGPNAFVNLADVEDLTIDGGGASVIFTRAAPIAMLTRCRRALLKGFAFDYDPPVYTAGRVVAKDVEAGTIDVDILPGHSLPDEFAAFRDDRKGMVVSEAEGCAIKRGAALVISNAGFQRIDGRRYRFQLANPKQAAQFDAGDIYVLDPRWRKESGGAAVSVFGGEDVVLFDLTIRGAANECLNSSYTDRHAILRVRLERKDGRALSVNNGGNNHHNARAGPWIEGCLFENTGDDICHVNGLVMGIERLIAADRLLLPLSQPYDQFGAEVTLDVRVGDRLQFFDAGRGRLVAERRVTAAASSENALAVTLNEPVEGLVPGRLVPAKGATQAALGNKEVTQVYDASRMCGQFVFRHNICRNGRRVGVLAKGEGGLIEGNVFENLGGGGVEMWNAPFEGLGATDYVVRGNTIRDCGRLDREHAAIWTTIFKTGGSRLQRNLLIADNDISGFPGQAILLRDAENVVIRGNRIALNEPAPAEDAEAKAIVQANTDGVTLEGNVVTNPSPGVRGQGRSRQP
ncbi:MAG: right-handed parallel beta-helix repeat-containing protein [Candidatus Sumerlaeota bacterium]|nr:right-handed parallel beta-helix repeat-containing protein [Candidatus Sumerlaeota bacterium]